MTYERDILDELHDARRPVRYPEVAVQVGMVVEDRASGFCGDVARWNVQAVTQRYRGRRHRQTARLPRTLVWCRHRSANVRFEIRPSSNLPGSVLLRPLIRNLRRCGTSRRTIVAGDIASSWLHTYDSMPVGS